MKFFSAILFMLLFLATSATATEDKLPTLEFKGMTFLQWDMSPRLRIYLTKEEYNQYQKNGAPEFTRQITEVINVLSLHHLFPPTGYYQVVVVPKGEDFKNISGLPFTQGIGGIDGWPEALIFDDSCFFALSPTASFVGLVHEFTHLVHGDLIEIYPILEGLAEAVPFYILNLTDEKQQEIALHLTPQEIYPVTTLIKNGMFIDNTKNTQAQYRKTYVSMYLWMRGYLETVQQKYNLDKLQALNFVLENFKQAAALPTLKQQEDYIAKLIGLKRKQVFDKINLQLTAQKSLKKSLASKF